MLECEHFGISTSDLTKTAHLRHISSGFSWSRHTHRCLQNHKTSFTYVEFYLFPFTVRLPTTDSNYSSLLKSIMFKVTDPTSTCATALIKYRHPKLIWSHSDLQDEKRSTRCHQHASPSLMRKSTNSFFWNICFTFETNFSPTSCTAGNQTTDQKAKTDTVIWFPALNRKKC